MALVCIGVQKDEYNRDVEVYKDTDDLSQEEYHEYSTIKKEKGVLAAIMYLKRH